MRGYPGLRNIDEWLLYRVIAFYNYVLWNRHSVLLGNAAVYSFFVGFLLQCYMATRQLRDDGFQSSLINIFFTVLILVMYGGMAVRMCRLHRPLQIRLLDLEDKGGDRETEQYLLTTMNKIALEHMGRFNVFRQTFIFLLPLNWFFLPEWTLWSLVNISALAFLLQMYFMASMVFPREPPKKKEAAPKLAVSTT